MAWIPASVLVAALVFAALAACAPEPASPPAPAGSTATANVHVLPPLEMRGLGRERTVRIYLPPGYEEAQRRYPVVYMHDGQNLFDDATSFVGEWGVDETLNELATDGLEVIVVGIDHGAALRVSELSPWPHEYTEAAEGEAYLDFIVETVKPFIDTTYRTLPGREHTAIFGSSLGGLMSHYAVAVRGDVFSKAGIFSPSYPLSDEVYAFTRRNPPPPDTELYLLAGGREGAAVVESVVRMREVLREAGHDTGRLTIAIDPQGEHNEAFWARHFGPAVTALYQSP